MYVQVRADASVRVWGINTQPPARLRGEPPPYGRCFALGKLLLATEQLLLLAPAAHGLHTNTAMW